MLIVRLAGAHLHWKKLCIWLSLVMLLVASFLCCPFSHEMFWMRSGTKLSQFLRVFLLLLLHECILSAGIVNNLKRNKS